MTKHGAGSRSGSYLTPSFVAEDDGGALVGLLVLDQDRVDQLYVEPTLTGRGIGSELIGLAKRARPQGLRLWTCESNLAAQRFYEKHGFRQVERTAGDNEEGAPTFSTSGRPRDVVVAVRKTFLQRTP